MAVLDVERAVGVPEQGNLVRVRDRFWVVEAVQRSSLPPDMLTVAGSGVHHGVRLVPIDDKGSPTPLIVFWEAEPGTEIRPQAELPDPAGGLDDAEVFGAFLDAARWGAIASADPSAFQAPFRAGIDIEDYQLLPLVKALGMPRVAMLIADDVGLGKTIEAGLVAEELVLRNQVRKIVVICPPSLCRKWQREMREKFGLSFEVVDTEYVRRLRRERGIGVNPFCSHPRLIVSMEWVKFESQMRWFDDFLPPDPNTYPRAFDLLIVDEAHQLAPAAVGRYAKDSLRTSALRRLAPHFEHRLFLTATPHNGYPESFQALLALLDPNRFARGVPPTDRERDAVMVRRLKTHLRELLPDGEHRFPKRRIQAIPVEFGTPEREMFGLLDRYVVARKATAGTPSERFALRFIALLLKKRLLSSPAAFKLTLDRHIQTLATATQGIVTSDAVERAASALDEDVDDEASLDELEQEALAIAASALPPASSTMDGPPRRVLEQLRALADANWRRPDAKTTTLLAWIASVCFPTGEWNDERVIVFTEYRATLNYLYEMVSAEGPGRPSMLHRVEVFHGGLDADERERIIREFNYNPRKTKVRILLATDAASEGIDLHLACHRLVHMEVPFNPNRMEQRNGRIDRHGQKSSHVDIFHFASTEDSAGPGSVDYDHDFLLRVARKIDDIRDDLGSVSSVLAERIEARMLGESSGRHALAIDEVVRARRDQARVDLKRVEQQFAADVARVREQYLASRDELDMAPSTVERAVRVGLQIAGQPDLTPGTLDRLGGAVLVFRVDDLTGTWAETLAGLYDEVADERLPVTFDPDVAHGHQDVAYLHVGHPLVARCLRTLRAQVWGAAVDRRINRVAVRYAEVAEPIAVAHARVVVNGADGSTLDEVIEPAAVRIGGRQGRLNVGETRAAVAATTTATPPAHVRDLYVGQWSRVRSALEEALRARAEEVRGQRERRMDEKRDREEQRLRGTLNDLKISIRKRLDEVESAANADQMRLWDDESVHRYQSDMRALRERIGRIDADIVAEVDILRRRYAVRDVHWFPVAVELLVPMGEH